MALSIFAPTTGTFTPGHDVMGIATGTDLPTELANWEPFGVGTGNKPKYALIGYNSAYLTTRTYSQVKYVFATFVNNPGVTQDIVHGAYVVLNASVNPSTGQIVAAQWLGFDITGTGGAGGLYPDVFHDFRGHNTERLAVIFEDDSQGDGAMDFYNNAGVRTVQIYSNFASPSGPDATSGAVFTVSQTGSTETGQLPNPL